MVVTGWHFVHHGQPQGPVDSRGLLELVMQGVLTEDVLVWADGWPEWRQLTEVPELAELLPPVAKRQRLGDPDGGSPPDAELLPEIPAWVDALDEASTVALFEKALFHHLGDAIKRRPSLRDALLCAYVQRHPDSDDRDPAAYEFTDSFLLEAVQVFDSQEEMWKALGADNGAAVKELVGVAAALDRRYCAQLQGLALLSRARRLLRQGASPRSSDAAVQPAGNNAATAAVGNGSGGGGEGGSGSSGDSSGANVGRQLAALLGEEEALSVARDMDGRSLWHDLVEGQSEELLRLLLPLAAGGGGCEQQQQQGEQQQHGGAEQQQQQQQGGSQGQQAQPEQEQQRAQQEAKHPQQDRQRQPSPLNLPDLQGNTPLHLAAEASLLGAARLLIEAGASLDMQNRDPSKYASGDWSVKSKGMDFAIPVPSLHQTPLHIAAEAGDLEMMHLLVEQGALLDLRDSSGSTPLHLALEAQDEQAVALLLGAGANPMLSNNDLGEESTPVHAAAAAGRPAILQALLSAWPRGRLAEAVSQPGENEFTPLMLAARRGNTDCVRLLLEHGADAGAANRQGRTAADIAAVNKREAVAALLAEWAQRGPVPQDAPGQQQQQS